MRKTRCRACCITSSRRSRFFSSQDNVVLTRSLLLKSAACQTLINGHSQAPHSHRRCPPPPPPSPADPPHGLSKAVNSAGDRPVHPIVQKCLLSWILPSPSGRAPYAMLLFARHGQAGICIPTCIFIFQVLVTVVAYIHMRHQAEPHTPATCTPTKRARREKQDKPASWRTRLPGPDHHPTHMPTCHGYHPGAACLGPRSACYLEVSSTPPALPPAYQRPRQTPGIWCAIPPPRNCVGESQARSLSYPGVTISGIN